MSEYAEDHMRGWLKAGMPYSSRGAFKEKCVVCGQYCRTMTGNWTSCEETGERHTKKSFDGGCP